MKSILIFLLLSLSLGTFAGAQRRKGPSSRSRTSAKKPVADATATPTVAGSPVTIVTKDGNKIIGAVVDMNVSAVRVKAEDQESSVPMTTVSSLSFGQAPTGEAAHPAGSSGHPDFQKDAASVMSGFHALLGEAKTAPDYTEYGGTLAELRRRAELFIGKYGSTEDPVEARFVALAASAVTDYTWARTIWALKLGHTGDVTVNRSDSPAVADTVGLYPEVKSAAASGDRFSVEKLIVGLWTQAGIKVERLRSLIGQTGQTH